MQNTLILYNIYKEYLKTTVRLIEFLECFTNEKTLKTKKKRKEFLLHALNLIIDFNRDLHKLLYINQELKNLGK